MTREEIISIGSRIKALREEIARLGPLQKELKALEAKLDCIADTPAAPPREVNTNSMVERVVYLVDSDPNKEWTAEAAAELLGTKLASTRAAFSKAVGAHRINKCGRGRFCSVRKPEDPDRIVTGTNVAA